MSADARLAQAGITTVTPYVIVEDALAAIAFYQRAFGAAEVSVSKSPAGKVQHAEIKVGESLIMLAEEFQYGGIVAKSPVSLGASCMHLYLYVPDVDALFARAISAGASEVMAVSDQPYAERSGGVADPFGHIWWIATRK